MRNKILSLLVLLLTAATGAWAQGYNVTFGGFAESEMNTTVNVASLPQTFTAIGNAPFYPWTVISTSGNYFHDASVTSGGEGKVSVSFGDQEMSITITGPFEGTATIHVTGEDDEERNISTDITVSCEAVGGASTPTIEVTTNAAQAGDFFTEATFTMPTFDATVNYDIVRDMQDEANPVAFSGLPSSGNIVVKKGSDGKYQPIETLTIQLIDPLAAAEAQNIIAADGITIKVLVGAENGQGAIDYDQENPITFEAFLADMKPGYYWIKAVPTDETTSPYIGTVYSSEFTVVEKYDLTVKPANDFSKGKIESVTVGSGSVTIDANTGEAAKTGIDPETEVKVKAKRGYVIDKVEVKKTMKLLTLTVNGVTIYYAEGDSWANAISRDENKDSGLFIREGNRVHHTNYGQLVDSNTEAVLPVAIINANESYRFIK